jgi:hypothetical protein
MKIKKGWGIAARGVAKISISFPGITASFSDLSADLCSTVIVHPPRMRSAQSPDWLGQFSQLPRR